MSMDNKTRARTYGGWRRSRAIGLLGLGPLSTLLVLAAVTGLVIAATVSFAILAVTGVPCVLALIATLARHDGAPLVQAVLVRLRWRYAVTRGHTSFRSGVMVAGEHAWSLPGVLAPTRLLSVPDPGGEFGVVHNPRTRTFTVTVDCAATTTWLADPDEGTAWVASWGAWLANLGHNVDISHVAITVDSAPDPGSRLSGHISSRILPDAPASAVRILRQLVDTAPTTAADVQTRVSITFRDPLALSQPDRTSDLTDRMARALPGLTDSLNACGVSVLGRMTAPDLVGVLRTAFDPIMRGDVERLRHLHGGALLSQWLDWECAGPMAAEEHLDRYVHDSGVSVSWAWHEAPRQHVHADVLVRLLSPGPHPKRVSLIYRPLPAADAIRAVEREVNAAAFRSSLHRLQRRDESARDHADRDRAERAAWEEATGAGVGFMSLFVTVTVTNPDQLPRAVADIEARAGAAKLRLRKLLAAQAAGFATTLPCGLFPPTLARAWPR
jgi:hypothetical protein